MITMEQILEQVKALRTAMDLAGSMLSDEQATQVSILYPEWDPNGVKVYDGTDGEHSQTRVRGRTSKLLYKCSISHVTQEDWPPELTPAMWTVINEENAGSAEDPIPAARGMEYEEGKLYLDPEDETIYLCTRGGTLHYLPHELIGHYFEVAAE